MEQCKKQLIIGKIGKTGIELERHYETYLKITPGNSL